MKVKLEIELKWYCDGNGYSAYARVYPRGHHQLAALHQRVTQLDRRDLEILNRRMPSDVSDIEEK